MRKLLILTVGLLLMPNFRIATAGQSIDDAKVVARTIIGNSLRPPRPKNQTINKIVNDRIITWDQTLASSLFSPETYIITIKNASTGAVMRTHTVVASTVPAMWTYNSGAGDQSKVTISTDGSISAVAPTAGVLYYHSQIFTGPSKIEWDVDSRIFLGMYVLDSGSGNVKAEIRNANLLGGGDIQFIDGDGASGLRHRLLPASKITIQTTDGQPDFLINDQFWMRGFAGPIPASYVLRASFESDTGSPLNEAQAYLRVRVTPLYPHQFIYTDGMVFNDFGSYPATVKVEIVQLSARGINSAIATVTG